MFGDLPLCASSARFIQRQHFAETQLVDLRSRRQKKNSWGSIRDSGIIYGRDWPRAVRAVRIRYRGVDGNGDGKIDLFEPEDAIPSASRIIWSLHGWDNNVDHQKRAVYAYYGGHYETDRDKYLHEGCIGFHADAVHTYLGDHPAEPGAGFMPDPVTLERARWLQNWPRSNPEVDSRRQGRLNWLVIGLWPLQAGWGRIVLLTLL